MGDTVLAGASMLRPLVVNADGLTRPPFSPLLLAGADDTGGGFEVYEAAQQALGQGVSGPPPHVHREHEEAFYVLTGDVTFTLGKDEAPAPIGTLVVVPRGTRHAFRMGPGSRVLIFAIPAGLAGFFREIEAAHAAGRDDLEARAELAARFDSAPTLD